MVESHGPINRDALQFLSEWGSWRLVETSGDVRASTLDCNCHTAGVRYKIALLKPSVKALMVSTRTSIRMDNRGFLSMQFMIRLDDGQICFAEYFVSRSSFAFSDNGKWYKYVCITTDQPLQTPNLILTTYPTLILRLQKQI